MTHVFRYNSKYQYSFTIALFGGGDLSDTDLLTEEKIKEHGVMAWRVGALKGYQRRVGKTNKPSFERSSRKTSPE